MSQVIQFELDKPNAAPMQLSLSKVAMYRIKLFWKTTHDIDAHAIALSSTGLDGDFQRVLSCFNPNMLQPNGENTYRGYTGPFANRDEYLKHKGDVRNGITASDELPDEIIEVWLPKIPSQIKEILFAMTIFPSTAGVFANVKDCYVVVEDDTGKELLRANLTGDFDQYNVAVTGGLIFDNGDWKFNPNSKGISGDFNSLLAQVSVR